jgi:hypothetical protein
LTFSTSFAGISKCIIVWSKIIHHITDVVTGIKLFFNRVS